MGDPIELSRRAIRNDLVVEVLLDRWPEPPPEMLRLPGVAQYANAIRLARERDNQGLRRIISQLRSRIEAVENNIQT